MGGLVAAGFSAKYPALVSSLTLISPMGISFADIPNEKYLRWPVVSDYLWFKKRKIAEETDGHFFDTSDEAPHRYLIDKQTAMLQWQMENTEGYMEAIRSTIVSFPLRSAEELFAAIGRHPRPVLVVWGDKDEITPYFEGTSSMEACFDRGTIVDIPDAAHNPIAEKFNETMLEVLSFAKEVVDRQSKQLKESL